MNDEQKIAYMQAMTVAASIEMESMKAANWMREMQGITIAYGEEEFLYLIDKYQLTNSDVF